MVIKKLIILNMAQDTPNEQTFRDDLQDSLQSDYELVHIDSDNLLVDAQSGEVNFVVNNEKLDLEDTFVFVRRLRKFSDLPALFCRFMLHRGVPFTDVENASHKVTTDKSYAVPVLAENHLPVPRTLVTHMHGLSANMQYVVDNIVFPCVIKGEGSKGEWVFKVDDVNELLAKAGEIAAEKETLLSIQELIPNTYDVRALVLGREFVAAIRRSASDGAFHNNVSKGGTAVPEQLSNTEIELCIEAGQVAGIDFAGVDFVRTDSGIKILEVNKSPQLGGMRSVYPDLSIGSSLKAHIQRVVNQES